MKSGSTLVLKATIVAMGLVALAICIVALPQAFSSDNTGAYQPILIGVGLSAVPFFVALYQAFMILRYIDSNRVFSMQSIGALKYIQYCGLIIGALYTLGIPYIYQVADQDDAPGVLAIGLIIIGGSFVAATAAGVLQKLLQHVVQMKSENDLTV